MKFILFLIFINSIFASANEELLQGAKEGNLALVKRAIELKADIESRNSEGETALILASWYGAPEIVDYLIKQGAYINAQDKEGYTAIAKAASLGVGKHYEIVEALINYCANLNIKNKEGLSPYILAKVNGHNELANALLKAGANEEKFYSIEEASRESLNSARLNDRNRFVYASYFKPRYDLKDPEGLTALHYAARNGNKQILTYLIRKNANLELVDDTGKTALIYAARRGHKDIVSILVDKEVDISVKDKEGLTAIDWAEKFGEKDIAQFLKLLNETE